MALLDKENWMSQLPTGLLTVPLNKLAIPGTHDSFTQTLDPSGPIANSESETLQRLGKCRCVRNIVYRWSVTQHLLTLQQLNNGIRYFDFRLSHPDQPTSATDIRVVHGLYGINVYTIIGTINEWLITHPKEVVILDWNHFYNFTPELHHHCFEVLKTVFAGKLCPPVNNISDITLQYLWSHSYQVLLFYQAGGGVDVPAIFWKSNAISSPWANTDNTTRLLEFLTDKLRSRPKDRFFVTQGLDTPRCKDIGFHLCGSLERNLSSRTTKRVVEWLQQNQSEFQPLVNIVICDFVEKYGFIDTVLDYNRAA